MNISIIIPTLNESKTIALLVSHLLLHSKSLVKEIIVVDGGSVDNTLQIASNLGVIAVSSPEKGRAAQMNFGASLSTGDILYFVHADTIPPIDFAQSILEKINDGYEAGRFRTCFDSNALLLFINAFFTRFDLFVCYGGDQSLFIRSSVFTSLDGFNQSMVIMEDYDIVTRLKKIARYGIIQKDILVSARKYELNSWWKVQKANYTIVNMYRKGASQADMILRYKKMLRFD